MPARKDYRSTIAGVEFFITDHTMQGNLCRHGCHDCCVISSKAVLSVDYRAPHYHRILSFQFSLVAFLEMHSDKEEEEKVANVLRWHASAAALFHNDEGTEPATVSYRTWRVSLAGNPTPSSFCI